MTKQETYDYLRARGAAFEITEHKAVYNMEECADLELPYPESDAKNLFVRDDKRRSYYLITVRGDKRVDLKAFRRAHGTRSAQLRLARRAAAIPAPHARLRHAAGAAAGRDAQRAVLPRRGVSAAAGRIGVHPNDNTATVWMRTDDLLRILREHGTSVELTQL